MCFTEFANDYSCNIYFFINFSVILEMRLCLVSLYRSLVCLRICNTCKFYKILMFMAWYNFPRCFLEQGFHSIWTDHQLGIAAINFDQHIHPNSNIKLLMLILFVYVFHCISSIWDVSFFFPGNFTVIT